MRGKISLAIVCIYIYNTLLLSIRKNFNSISAVSLPHFDDERFAQNFYFPFLFIFAFTVRSLENSEPSAHVTSQLKNALDELAYTIVSIARKDREKGPIECTSIVGCAAGGGAGRG